MQIREMDRPLFEKLNTLRDSLALLAQAFIEDAKESCPGAYARHEREINNALDELVNVDLTGFLSCDEPPPGKSR